MKNLNPPKIIFTNFFLGESSQPGRGKAATSTPADTAPSFGVFADLEKRVDHCDLELGQREFELEFGLEHNLESEPVIEPRFKVNKYTESFVI